MINRHHITYDPEWIVELNGIQHQTLGAIQRTKPTPEKYAALTNFVHAVTYAWNNMRMELDINEQTTEGQ